MAGPITSLTPAPQVISNAPTSLALPLGPTPFDPIETLPPAAAEKLRLLRQRSADTHAVIPMHEDIREAIADRTAAEQRLRQLTDHPQNQGFGLRADNAGVVAQKKLVDKLADDLRRLQELQQVRTAAWQSASGALAACEAWLKSGRPGGTSLAEYDDGPEPKPNKGETILDAVARLRRRGRELRADAARIAASQFPAAYTKEKMRRQIAQLAEQGCPDVSLLVEHDRDITFPTQRLTSEVHGEHRQLAFTQVADGTGLVAWMFQDALVERLDALIDAEMDTGATPLSHEERERRTAEVLGDLLSVERDESWFVWMGQSQGLPCEHRPDVSVLALLSIDLVTVPRPDASPPTTAGLSWPWPHR
jgi:hypothetical protein